VNGTILNFKLGLKFVLNFNCIGVTVDNTHSKVQF